MASVVRDPRGRSPGPGRLLHRREGTPAKEIDGIDRQIEGAGDGPPTRQSGAGSQARDPD